MRLVVTLEARFAMTPDGNCWTDGVFHESFWERYLKVFDEVRVVARAELRTRIDGTYRRVTGDRIQFFPLPHYIGLHQYLRKRSAVKRALQQAVGPADAVLMRVGSRLADDLEPALCRARRPYALEVVGDPYNVFAPGAVRHRLRPLFRFFSTRSLKQQCARATAVSYVTRSSLQKRYPLAAREEDDAGRCSRRMESHYSSIELRDCDYLDTPRKFDARKDKRLVLVGSVEQMYKGVDVLLNAVQHLTNHDQDNVQLTVIGDGRHRAELEQLARRLGIAKRTEFLGQLPAGAAVREQLDRADLFVLPSRSEGLPRAMIEAMARALPCIGTHVGGIPELLEPEHMVSPGNAHELAAKLGKVLHDPAEMTRMSQRNLAEARSYHCGVLEGRRTEFYTFLRERTEEWLHSARNSR